MSYAVSQLYLVLYFSFVKASGRGLPRIQPEKNLIPIMNMCTPSRLAASNIPGLNLNNKTVAKDGDQSALSSAKEQEAVFAMPTAPPRSAHKVRHLCDGFHQQFAKLM